MATARVPVGNTLYQIAINLSGQSNSPGITIGPTDSIEFKNLAPYPVQIQFICANGPVFNNIVSIPANGGTSPAQSPQETQITTDYNIINVNNPNSFQGPYSIMVGINTKTVAAPLYVPITSCEPPTSPNMGTVAVPQNGWIEFNLDQAYNLSWNPGSAFPIPSNPVGPGAYTVQAQTGNQNGTAAYSFDDGRPVAKTGGGTVMIKS
jgi:hypothetical protein